MMGSSTTYRLIGLTLQSDRAIPGWPEGVGEADVALREADDAFWTSLSSDMPVEVVFEGGGTGQLVVRRVDDGWWWSYPDGTQFHISEALDLVRWKNPPHFELADLASYLEGPVLGFVARQRGLHILHASGVVMPSGGVVLITAPSGGGKSTMAAAAHAEGLGVLTDDVAVIRDSEEGVFVEPSNLRIRLWPEAEELIGRPLPQISEAWEKRYIEFSRSRAPERLLGIAVLEDGALSIEEMKAAEGLIYVVGNVYLDYALKARDRAADLDFFARVLETIPVFRLCRPRTFEGAREAIKTFQDLMEGHGDG